MIRLNPPPALVAKLFGLFATATSNFKAIRNIFSVRQDKDLIIHYCWRHATVWLVTSIAKPGSQRSLAGQNSRQIKVTQASSVLHSWARPGHKKATTGTHPPSPEKSRQHTANSDQIGGKHRDDWDKESMCLKFCFYLLCGGRYWWMLQV